MKAFTAGPKNEEEDCVYLESDNYAQDPRENAYFKGIGRSTNIEDNEESDSVHYYAARNFLVKKIKCGTCEIKSQDIAENNKKKELPEILNTNPRIENRKQILKSSTKIRQNGENIGNMILIFRRAINYIFT